MLGGRLTTNITRADDSYVASPGNFQQQKKNMHIYKSTLFFLAVKICPPIESHQDSARTEYDETMLRG